MAIGNLWGDNLPFLHLDQSLFIHYKEAIIWVGGNGTLPFTIDSPQWRSAIRNQLSPSSIRLKKIMMAIG
jgi:hypothetical protein